MDEIKEQYINPNPVLYRYRGFPETSLASYDFDNVNNIKKSESQNEVTTLTFEIPFTKDRKININDCEKLVKFEGQYYIIKKIETKNDSTSTMTVTCESEQTELKGVYCTYLDMIGKTPKEMFDTIMSSTMHPANVSYKWKGTDVVDKRRHLQTDSEESVYGNLVAMAEVFNGWLEFSTDENEQNWVYLRTNYIESNKFITKDLDMKSLGITYSSEEIFTRLEPFGYTDNDGIELNIMKVNPTGKSYIENYSWYVGMGIPDDVIKSQAKYQQLKVLRETDYTDANDLLELAKEELAKYCVPQLDATLEMSDVSIYVDSLDIPPKVGYKIRCINEDINFIFDCAITGVERDYENPLNTSITISNIIRYDTQMQNINHSVTTTDNITSSDPSGVYVPAEKVIVTEKDTGDHVNVTKKFGNHQTLITQNAYEIKLTAEDLNNSKAEIKVTTDKITQSVTDLSNNTSAKFEIQAGQIQSTVEGLNGAKSQITQLSGRITSTVEDLNGAKSEINQLSNEISSKVDEDEFGSLITQNARSVAVAIHGETDNSVTIDSDGLTVTDGGFLFENNDGEEIFKCKTNGAVVLGNSDWTVDESLEKVVLGKFPLGSYLTISVLNNGIDENLDMFSSDTYHDITGVGDFETQSFYCKKDGEFNSDLYVDDTLYCGRLECNDKHGVIDTEDYGRILINAYETAEYYFGDIGEDTIGEGGKIEIKIEEKFKQTVNTSINYHVFTSTYEGKINKIEKFKDKFIVYGDINTNFSWEIKAKAKGKETVRLENSKTNNN